VKGAELSRRSADTARSEPAQQRGTATRGAILDAARQVFEDKGIVEATVDDFVRTAGVARGTFYTYFADKYDLLTALYRDVTEQLLQQAKTDAMLNLTTMERIERRVETLIYYFRENMGVMRATSQLAATRQDLRELVRQFSAAYTDGIRRDVEKVTAQVGTRCLSPHVVAAAIHAMLGRFCTDWFGQDLPPYPGAEIEGVTRELSILVYRVIFGHDPDDAGTGMTPKNSPITN
jgi:AcrR family transcriptional regulator